MKRPSIKITYKLLATVLTVAFCLFLLPNPAHAQAFDWLVGNSVLTLLAGTLNFIRAAIVSLIGTLASGIDSILKFGIADSPVVKESWEIVRNFANMLFIIALIVMAFGTIFNIRGYDVKTLIPRFIIAALLINFSLVIGNVIIGWTQSLSNVFLTSIGDIGARIATGVSIADLFQQSLTQTYTVDNRLWTETITIFFNILLLSIVLFSLLVLFVLTIIRIPVLWALLIVSPVAWMAYILPSTNHISQKWWKEFIGWNLFLPIYLFFIYFGTFFLANRSRVISGMTSQPLAGGVGTTFQQLFFFVLVAIFLIGGAKVAMGMSSAAGAGSLAGWAYGKGAVMRRAAWKGTGIPGAYKEAKEYYGREGVRIPGTERRMFGTRQQEEKVGRIAKLFGVPGVNEKLINQQVEAATKQLKDKKVYENKDALLKLVDTGTPEQKIAAANLLREFHKELGVDQIVKGYQAHGPAKLAAKKFLNSINYKSMSPSDLEKLLADKITLEDGTEIDNPLLTEREMREKVVGALSDRNMFTSVGDFKKKMSIFTSEGDRVDAIRKTEDWRDKLSKSEGLELYEAFKGNPAAQRELAPLLLKKGHFDDKKLTEILRIVKDGGLYETPFEIESAMRLAEERRPMSILDIRERMGLLGRNDDDSPKTRKQVLQSMLSRISVEGIVKVRPDGLADKDGNLTPGGEEFMEEMEARLRKNPSRIRSITIHKDYTDEHVKIYEKMFEKIRAETAKIRTTKSEIRKPKRSDTPPDDNTPPS